MEKKDKKKRSFRKTLIEGIIGIVMILLCLYVTLTVVISNKKGVPPSVFGLSVSYVPSKSMEPTIHSGDYILFRKASFNGIEVDDIIIYKNKSEDKFVVHRVIAINYDDDNKKYFVTKGDNNTSEDTVKVYENIFYGKYVTRLTILSGKGSTSSNLIFISLIIIFILMITAQITQIVLTKKNQTRKEEAEKSQLKYEQLKEQMKLEIMKEELEALKKKNDEASQEQIIEDSNLDNENKEESNEEK
ncbi:MAG: signal peptidase I [Acholeplasmatales bacterium]|nr:signal peptidase I [Acholeplasmatales bacterium]